MYAVIATGGKQYKVAVGDEILLRSWKAKSAKRLHSIRYYWFREMTV